MYRTIVKAKHGVHALEKGTWTTDDSGHRKFYSRAYPSLPWPKLKDEDLKEEITTTYSKEQSKIKKLTILEKIYGLFKSTDPS